MRRIPDLATGLGISWLWMLPSWHPFSFFGALWHDQAYSLRVAGLLLDRTSKKTDREFRNRCRTVAQTAYRIDTRKRDRILIAQAEMFYPIVRVWGTFHWPKIKVI